MTADQFAALCRGVARTLDLKDEKALLNAATVSVDGAMVGIAHLEETDPDAVHVYVDLGAIQAQAAAATMLEKLLELNLSLDGELGEVIGMESVSRHLVLRARLHERGNGQEALHEGFLANQLRNYAALANELCEKLLPDIERAS